MNELVATSASGLAWTAVYIALIYRGIKIKRTACRLCLWH